MTQLITTNTDTINKEEKVSSLNPSKPQFVEVVEQAFKELNSEQRETKTHRFEKVSKKSPKAPSRPPGVEKSSEQARAEKNGHCWECIDVREDIFGGNIFIFALKNEFNPKKNPTTAKQAFDRKNDELFPGIELTVEDIKNLHVEEFQKEFEELGYKFNLEGDTPTIEVPDKVALKIRFENRLRKIHPELKPLKIIDSDGIADDISFTAAYPLYDMLLSSGHEFVHDHLSHIIPTLLFIFENSQQYYVERKRLAGVIEKLHDRLLIIEKAVLDGVITGFTQNQLEKLRAILGAAVDVMWSFTVPVPGITIDYFDGKINHFIQLMDGSHKGFWARRFEGEEFKSYDLNILWKHARDFE